MTGTAKVSQSARSKLFANAKKAALNARRSMWDLVEAIGEIQDALGSQAVLQAEVDDSIGFSRGYAHAKIALKATTAQKAMESRWYCRA